MMAGRYAHARQFNRHHREVRFLRTRLGHLIRDIRRKIAGHELARASQIPSQRPRQRGWKVYSFHAPRSSASARQGPRTLRVRREGLDCHHQCLLAGGGAVRAARRHAAGHPYGRASSTGSP